jgi:hypothetical protein
VEAPLQAGGALRPALAMASRHGQIMLKMRTSLKRRLRLEPLVGIGCTAEENIWLGRSI